LFVFARSGLVLVLAPLLAVLTLAGCGPKKTATPAPSTATTPGRGSSSTVQGGAGAKTCTAGHTQAIINGQRKCLAAGQTCSSKAISQYPQYGYVCLTSNGRRTLRRK